MTEQAPAAGSSSLETSGARWHVRARSLRECTDQLDAIWASFSGPLFWAALELWIAARSDEELRRDLVRFERQVGRAMASLFSDLAGADAERSTNFAALLELTFHMMRGIALQRILRDDDTQRRELFEIWKRLVSESLGRAKRREK